MANKKQTFVDIELDWAEQQLATWKAYVDSHPVDKLQHEQVGKIVITIQDQGKFLQETLKNYLALLKEVNLMREKEATKVESRGKGQISTLAEDFLSERK